MHDREIYTQRQSLLDEIEILRKREAEIKREDETNHRFVSYDLRLKVTYWTEPLFCYILISY